MLFHPRGFQPEQGVEQVVGISAKQRSRQPHNAVGTGGQSAQGIALRRVAGQLMDFVADRVIKPARHVTPDELNGRHAPDLVGIGLPECAMDRSACFIASGFDRLRDFDLFKFGSRQSALIYDDWSARVGIDHATEIGTRTWYAVSVTPEVSELRPFTADDEQGWSSTQATASAAGESSRTFAIAVR